VKECGEISIYDSKWDKVSARKPKTLKNYKGHTFEENIFDDPVME